MSGVATALLGDLLTEAKSGFACGDEDKDGILQLRMNNVMRDGSLDFRKKRRVPASHKAIASTQVEPGDVLFNATNSPEMVGKTALIRTCEETMVFSNHFLRLRPRQELLDAGYLARWLQQQFSIGTFRAMCRQWVNQATVGREDLLRLSIPIPPVIEQRRIAGLLDEADDLRAKRRQTIAKLGHLTQVLFFETFGDPASNSRGWQMQTVGELLESATYGTSAKASTTEGLPVVRMNNVTSAGDMDLRDLKYLAAGSVGERHLVRAGDVLFNRTNSPELVGKTAIYRMPHEMAYAGYLVRLRVNENNTAEYLSAFLNSPYGKSALKSMCKSIIGMANINARELQAMRIPRPPLEVQQTFVGYVAKVELLKQRCRQQSTELDELFRSLQDQAFRGEL